MKYPAWTRYVAACILSRVPGTMPVFGLVLAGREIGSFGLGGRLAAVYTVTGMVTSVWGGRYLDRNDVRVGLRRAGIAVGVVAVAIAAAVAFTENVPLVAALSVALGAVIAPIPGGYRALLPTVVPPEEIGAAYAFDGVCIELCFVTGPAVAGLVAFVSGPSAVFVAMSVCALAGAYAVHRLPSAPAQHSADTPVHEGSQLKIRAMQGAVAGAVALGISIGCVDATFPAFASDLGHDAAVGGLFVACMAFGSGSGGLLFGPKAAASSNLGLNAVSMLMLFGVLVLPFAVAPNIGLAALMALAAGAPFAVMSTSCSVLVQKSVPATRTSEAFSMLNAAILGGSAVGAGLSSVLVDSAGPRSAMAVASGPAVIVGAVLLWTSSHPPRESPAVSSVADGGVGDGAGRGRSSTR
ncbi:MAG: MFS transporter [Acidimicrobiia bacterium]